MPRIVASIEARMGSSRLPGKILMDVQGQPAIQRLVNRLRLCRSLDDIIVATTTSRSDDVLASWCAANGVNCHRGSEDDVLARVVAAQRAAKSDIVVEITGDCILTDFEIVDLGIETFLAHDVDVVTNCGGVLTWPMGIYVQVFPLPLLSDVAERQNDPEIREHVSLYFYRHPEQYRIIDLLAPACWQAPEYRFQLDFPEDLEFINEIYRRLEPVFGEGFKISSIVNLLREEPQLLEINGHCEERVAL
jgi:spore coat polysaccharide biosynthesis protein SpsF